LPMSIFCGGTLVLLSTISNDKVSEPQSISSAKD
jgi:hypothetical protein